MNKRLLFFIFQSSFFISCATAQPLMRDVFAAIPDSVLPMVTKNNRLDCIDFIENNMQARVRNKVDSYVTLEALTADYARFRTSDVSFMEMKLLPLGNVPSDSTGSGFVLCVVTTVESGEADTERRIADSNIRILNADWSSLPADSKVNVTSIIQQRDGDAFFAAAPADSLRDTAAEARRSLSSFHPVLMTLAPEDVTLTLTMQPGYLATEERKAIKDCLRPVTMRWNGRNFVAE